MYHDVAVGAAGLQLIINRMTVQKLNKVVQHPHPPSTHIFPLPARLM
jgi:hypothetical protein